jgi:DNA-binding transcriptional LysR family regulator
MRSGANLRAHADAVLSDLSIAAQPAMELDSVEAIKRMVQEGLGAALLPRVAVEAEERSGELRVEALPGRPGRDVFLVLPAPEARCAAANYFGYIADENLLGGRLEASGASESL